MRPTTPTFEEIRRKLHSDCDKTTRELRRLQAALKDLGRSGMPKDKYVRDHSAVTITVTQVERVTRVADTLSRSYNAPVVLPQSNEEWFYLSKLLRGRIKEKSQDQRYRRQTLKAVTVAIRLKAMSNSIGIPPRAEHAVKAINTVL